MLLPTIQRRRRFRPTGRFKSRSPKLWPDLTLEHQTQVAHVLAVLVRRLHQQHQTEGSRVDHA
jgi:hypothetical protein